MVSELVSRLCQEKDTVTSYLSTHPTEAPGDVFKRLFGEGTKSPRKGAGDGSSSSGGGSGGDGDGGSSSEAQETAASCGTWGPTKPSALFLQAFGDALGCLAGDPLCGMVSPPLMGSHGTMPLTVIAPLADIIRHCSNLIVRAKKDVLFITSAWSPSVAQRLVKNALIELSRRAGERGQRVVVKLMVDKPGPGHFVDSHRILAPNQYSAEAIQLPKPEEIPHLDFEVINLHNVMLGTLHAKFCVIDRQVAAIMSNNVEDNDNVEMMTHVEGPIVDSVYDTALLTWNKALNPPPPSLSASDSLERLTKSDEEPLYVHREIGRNQAQIAMEGQQQSHLEEHTPENPQYDTDMAGEITRMQACYSHKPHESRLQAAGRQLNRAAKNPVDPTGPEIPDGKEMTPYISTMTQAPVPMALVSRSAYGLMDHKDVNKPQNQAWLSLIRNAKRDVFIQTPDLNAAPLIPALADALKRGVEVTYYICFGYNDGGEIMPGQGGTNEQASKALIAMLPEDGPERKRLHIFDYVGKDQDHPIHNLHKSRSCHIKLLIADGLVGVQGSGNQDTQSWSHSQELNVMVDSPEICEVWREGIERNQNTQEFGRVADDGVWRDADGQPGEGYMGNPGTIEGLVKGTKWMFKKRLA